MKYPAATTLLCMLLLVAATGAAAVGSDGQEMVSNAAAAAAAAKAKYGDNAQPTSVTICHFYGTFYAALYEVVRSVLTDLGIASSCPQPSSPQFNYKEIYYSVGSGGTIDMAVAEWVPAHSKFYEPQTGFIETIDTIASGAGFYWAVPEALDVDSLGLYSIADLTKPKVRSVLNNTIYGPTGDSFMATAARTIMKSYGLDAYYNYVQLSAPEFFGMLVNRLGSPGASPNFVYPSFAPSFLDKFPHHTLEDPMGLDGPSNLMNFIKHTGFSAGTYADTVLSRIVIPVAQLSEMDYNVNVAKMNATMAAQTWIRDHATVYKSWFAQ